ncbi:MAG: hypothetical protein H7Y88_10390 [Phycisphaerales bacterium]|nr:hypothetical protein [Phycisphaerales bacterium]
MATLPQARLTPDSPGGNGNTLIRHSVPGGLKPIGDASGGGGGGGGAAKPAVGPNGGSAAPARPEPRSIAVSEDDERPEAKPQIKSFEQVLSAKHNDSEWKRKPTKSGTGACHVRSFHCKLTGDTLDNLDRQINEWLDAHPDFEVKFTNATIGDWTGKLKEPNLIVQVWV